MHFTHLIHVFFSLIYLIIKKVINKVVKCGKKWYIFVFIQNTGVKVKNLIGMYECNADAKGRLMLPSGLKKQMYAELQLGFVVKRSVFNTCLELHPMSGWNSIMDDVNTLNRFVKKNNDFIRMFTSGVRMVEPDSTSRIQIPKDLINFAGIGKKVVLASVGSIVEIWDKEQYERTVNDSSVDFGVLAEQVMGGNDKSVNNE